MLAKVDAIVTAAVKTDRWSYSAVFLCKSKGRSLINPAQFVCKYLISACNTFTYIPGNFSREMCDAPVAATVEYRKAAVRTREI